MNLFNNQNSPVGYYFSRLKQKLSISAPRRAMALLLVQFLLLILLVGIQIFVLIVLKAEQLIVYTGMIICLSVNIILGIHLNLTARYKAAAWITMIGVALGPWASLLIDPDILQGEILPWHIL